MVKTLEKKIIFPKFAHHKTKQKKKRKKIMKKILMMLFMLPLMSIAQVKDAKYVAKDAVPVENGRVIFTKEFKVPMTSTELYTALQEWTKEQYAPVKEMPNHQILEGNPETLEVAARGEEWLVFTNKFLSLDRTRLYYRISLSCYDQKVVARIFDIRYWYEEEREGGERYKAEEWITNEWALNKKGTKLAKKSGKFRRMTIDRMEEIFTNIETFINRKAINNIMQ